MAREPRGPSRALIRRQSSRKAIVTGGGHSLLGLPLPSQLTLSTPLAPCTCQAVGHRGGRGAVGEERTGMFAFHGPFPCVGSSEHAVRMESASANLGPGPDRAGPGKPTLA